MVNSFFNEIYEKMGVLQKEKNQMKLLKEIMSSKWNLKNI